MKFKTARICAGHYEVSEVSADSLRVRYVEVTKVHYPGDGEYWIAAASWDRFVYSDPVLTKREAVESAKSMLTTDYSNI